MSGYRKVLQPAGIGRVSRRPSAPFSPPSGGGADVYPDKYLAPRSRLRSVNPNAKPAGFVAKKLLPIVVLLVISIAFYQDDHATGLDVQSGVHLAGYTLAALASLFALGTRRLRMDFWMFVWCLVPLFITATALYAPEPALSFTAGLAHLALLLFAWRMVSRFGHLNAVTTIMIAGTIIGLLSIFVYYAYPNFAVATSDSGLGEMAGRMRGVTTQPNLLGLTSAFSVLLAVVHFKAFSPRQRLLVAFAVCVGSFCLVYSDSRTPIVALTICIGLWWLCRVNAALNLFTIVGIALGATLLIAFVPDFSAYLTRAGARSDDLQSLNGRSDIWQVAWENIRAHPLLGQGYGASRSILPVDDRLFAAAVNTHNLYLELLFSGGAVLLLLFAVGTGAAIVRSAGQRRLEALILLLFFLIVGGAEAAPWSGLPLFSAFAFYTTLALCLASWHRQPQAFRSDGLRGTGSHPSVGARSRGSVAFVP